MSGVDLYTVQKLMGHSTISMTERYLHLAPNQLKKAVSLMEAELDKNKIISISEIRKESQQ